MQEYERQIIVTNQGPLSRARLRVIRLPTSWYGVIWESRARYASFSQDQTDTNGGHEHLGDREFLDRVRLVAHFTNDVAFDYLDA